MQKFQQKKLNHFIKSVQILTEPDIYRDYDVETGLMKVASEHTVFEQPCGVVRFQKIQDF